MGCCILWKTAGISIKEVFVPLSVYLLEVTLGTLN
ncbi:unnamed protein product [Tenebrio molitor]|nr:unnamed protein product [Tenebrio molitor]